MSKDLSALAAKLFIQTNSVLSPTFYKANFSRGGKIFKRTADKISFGPV